METITKCNSCGNKIVTKLEIKEGSKMYCGGCIEFLDPDTVNKTNGFSMISAYDLANKDFKELTVEEMAKIIAKEIDLKGSLSYVQIEELFEKEGMEYEGGYWIKSKMESIYTWMGINHNFINVLNKLRKIGTGYKEEPCTRFVYIVDGKVPKIPVVKQARVHKSDRWLPVVWIKSKKKKGA